MSESGNTPHGNRVDSLRKRYFYKLLTNLISLPVYLVTQAVIPRGLGPQAYGDFNFLTSFFTQVMTFLDMGTSTAFYTKLSQRPNETALVSFYIYFILFSVIALFTGVAVAINTPVFRIIWPNQGIWFIYLAVIWGILNWVLQVLQKITDSYGLTVNSEIARMFQRITGMVFIVILFWFNSLHLKSLFYLYYLIMGLLIFCFIYIIWKEHYNINLLALRLKQSKNYIKEFYQYCHPLFIYGLVCLIAGIFDRWLLQVFGGSVEQGFFGLAYQIGAGCFIFTGAMTPLLMREFAIAFGESDLNRMASLFRRYIPMFYSITAFFACFIAAQADKVVYIMGGKRFSGAVAAMTLMALFPIHQTYGQLSNSVFFATGQTALYRNIGVVFMVLGLPVTYFFIAPHSALGLDAGATGLAIKTVLLQILAVNVMLYYNAKVLKLHFWKYVGHQVLSLTGLLAIAFSVRVMIDRAMPSHTYIIVPFLVAGMLYTLIVIAAVVVKPVALGFKREDVDIAFAKFRGILNF
jgi:O-antigen/teichoic acid export membrane protein